jgi:DNA-directed RNA polymerase specialized sigma24 family protein
VIPLSSLVDESSHPVDTRTPPPYERLDAEDEAEGLLTRLDGEEETLRAVALLRSQGLSAGQVAAALGVSESTVRRRVRRIRSIWAPDGRRDV